MVDDPVFQVDPTCLEWLEAHTQDAHGKELDYFHDIVTFELITAKMNDLSLYAELAMMVGPRSTHLTRTTVGSTCYTMLGGDQGG